LVFWIIGANDKKLNDKYLITKNIANLKKESVVNNDKELSNSDINSMKNHNDFYDELLKNYVDNSKKALECKLKLKKIFFWLCMVILIISSICVIAFPLIAIFCTSFNNDIANFITICVTSVISFLTSFLVLPKIIAEYLFNNEEEKNMVQIISSIQDYDKHIRNNLK